MQQQQAGSHQAVWSALKASLARVGAVENSNEFLKRMMKGQSGVGEDNANEKDFRAQALESQNLQAFVGMVKRDTKLKLFCSMENIMTFLPLIISVGVSLDLWGTGPWLEGHWFSRFHEINHGSVQRCSVWKIQLKFRATLGRKETTTPCGICQEILKSKSKFYKTGDGALFNGQVAGPIK